jgi:Protein of unknown function (DUF3826)
VQKAGQKKQQARLNPPPPRCSGTRPQNSRRAVAPGVPIHFLTMKHLLSFLLCVVPLRAAPDKAPDTEAAYTAKLEQRAGDILSALALPDAAQSEKVKNILISHYRALRDWHAANDAKLKIADEATAAPIRATLKVLHDAFLKSLSDAGLSDALVETVKDRMVYGKVQVTYNAYLQQNPDLTDAHKAQILAWLKEARELAMDGGSSEEKSAIFNKFKGRINNYLSKEGFGKKKV